MDFHMLSRRDLQALCKRNKIPANITNVAMADSLKALKFVEGIEEFSQSCQSETAQSSIESPMKNVVTSPYVPPTGGRSTRRKNIAKEEPETAKPSARAPRTARKTQQAASAGKKMDIQEETSDVSVTPAPSGVTTRRRRGVKEETTVNHAYTTRRSTRLAVRNVQLSNEVGNDNLDKELFTNDCQESKMISNEGSGDVDEASGVSGGVDEDVDVDVNSEKKADAEVDSAEIQDMSTVDKEEPVPAIEDEVRNQSEADGAKLELKDTCDVVIEEVGFGSETAAEAVSAEKEVEAEVVSAGKQGISTVDIGELVPTIEEEINQSEADGAKLELKDTSDVEIEEVGFASEPEAAVEPEDVSVDKEVEAEDVSAEKEVAEDVSAEKEVGFGSVTEAEYVSPEKEVEAEAVSSEKLDMGEPAAIEDDLIKPSEADDANMELMDTYDVEIEEVGFGSETEAEAEKEERDETKASSGDEVEIEADDAKVELMDACEVEIEEVGFASETEAEVEKEECDETKASNDKITAEEIGGSLDVKTSETEVQNQAVIECEDDVALESEDNSTDSEASEDETEENVSNVDTEDVAEMNVNEEVLDIDANVQNEDETEENVSNVDIEDVAEMNVNEEVLDIDANVQNEINPNASDSITLDQKTDDISSSEVSLDISLMSEEEEASKWETVFAYVNEKHDAVVEDDKKDAQYQPCLAPIKASASNALSAKKERPPPSAVVNEKHDAVVEDDTKDVQDQPCLTPIKASASNALSAKKERPPPSAVVTDNKENFGRTTVKTSKDNELKELSVRKLTKMLKEKLNIMKDTSQNENCNEAVPKARTALQVLPENHSA